jgi:plasmid stabilization system protein ParE
MPARKLSFHPAARDDAAGARQWYSQRSAIAARAFLTELILAVESVREAPERWPRYLAGTRQYHFPKFPFSLIYRVSDEAIVVIAIAHHRRKPGYWLERH